MTGKALREVIGFWLGVLAAATSGPAPSQEGSQDESRDVTVGPEPGCLECHGGWAQKKYVHSPVERKVCRSCHEQVGPSVPPGPTSCVARWRLADSEGELCGSCHPLALKNFVHAPVARGQCTACHDPHGSGELHLLRQDPAADLCVSCHEHGRKEYAEQPFGHEPASAGSCILCHEPHSSWNPRLLVRTGSRLCLTCHEEVRAAAAPKRHVHPPLLQDCAVCHAPHGSRFPALLRAGRRELCLGCHERIEHLLEASPHVHGAVGGDQSCSACHSSHASDLPRLLKSSLLDICLECHDRPVQSADGRMLANMAELLRDNPDYHGPVRRADCSSCHDPHASVNFRLLRELYPEELYVPDFDVESYALCFRCHFKELVLTERGRGVTRFRHGEVNLHYVHVTREKSRSCRACHAIHASSNPAHLVDTFSFGNWKDAPLGFEELPDGGSCASACHRKVAYSRTSTEPVPVVK